MIELLKNIAIFLKENNIQCRLITYEWGFRRLNEVCVDYFYTHAPYHKWKNFRLLAVDGSRLHLPNHHTIMEKLKSGDLLLLDRSYPSISLFFKLMTKGVDFCVRMKGSWWHQVRQFRESGLEEQTISFELPKKS